MDINTDEERIQFLQRVLLDFLAVKSQSDESHRYARHFYIAQWYKEAVNEKINISSADSKQKRGHIKDNHRNKKTDKSK